MSLRQCTFSESDWTALAPYWYPVAFSDEVAEKPIAAQLLDERLVLYRLANGKVTAARDLCLHRGIRLSMGSLEGDTLVCAYHGFRYDGEGRCVLRMHPGTSGCGNSSQAKAADLSDAGAIWISVDPIG
jgi:phenylpropionate dioxygenase-like ring-hydroxylating dioxygenase large terminal subunit